MECKNFNLTASAYIDRQLKETEAIEYREHLSECDGCRLHLAETEAISLRLRNIVPPPLPRELHSNIMIQATRRARREITPGELFYEWLLKLNPRPVAVAA
jgi:anti-sigma factor RsiW